MWVGMELWCITIRKEAFSFYFQNFGAYEKSLEYICKRNINNGTYNEDVEALSIRLKIHYSYKSASVKSIKMWLQNNKGW